MITHMANGTGAACPPLSFIGHEFVIYLLKSALREEDAFRSDLTWAVIEGLAEHDLLRLMGPAPMNDSFRPYADVCRRLDREGMTAAQLYRAAKEGRSV